MIACKGFYSHVDSWAPNTWRPIYILLHFMTSGINSVQLYSRGIDGHRAAYIDFSSKLLGGARTDVRRMMFSSEPVLFLMIEEFFSLYVFIAIWRAVFGWNTVGLLFRPKPALYGKTIRLKIKKSVLIFLKKIKFAKTLSIVPASLDENINKISSGWIYDFQLWDVADKNKLPSAVEASQNLSNSVDVVRDVLQRADGRKIIIAIGRQNFIKGFDLFAKICASGDWGSKYFFVSGGRIDEECLDFKSQMERSGGYVIDRFISDEELNALYSVASLVWCVYSENYDQASGVLGRAVQFGVPVLVRSKSYSHRFCQEEGVAHLALENDLALPLDRIKFSGAGVSILKFKQASLEVLRRSLWD